MDFEQAERQFQKLQEQRGSGDLTEASFRVEVAKLLLRDEQGAFWMLDAGDGAWFCNRGARWQPGDPHAERPLQAGELLSQPAGRRIGPFLVAGVLVVALLAAVGTMALLQWPPALWDLAQPAPTSSVLVQVAIASPADGDQVTLGQEVAVESTLAAPLGLQAVARVELRVNEQVVDTQSVRSKVQAGEASFPLSQPWLPAAAGEHQVAVIALSEEGTILGQASIVLYAVEAAGASLSEPACTPGATFQADVTIPPGSAFPPGARMDKVWQVRNSGTCAWGVGYELVLVEGEGLGAPSAVPAPPTAAGESADLAVTFWAPAEAGNYVDVWQLQSPDGSFFGPQLTLDVQVEVLAQESLPPTAPTGLQAAVTENGEAVQLAWRDQSDDEDAFRVYREDVEASIGLAPADAEVFVDENVTCGNVYRYAVVAFNAAGPSPISETSEVTLPPCAPADALPTLTLTVVPTQVVASAAFTVTFEATDDLGLVEVRVWGEGTGDPELDGGQVSFCTEAICAGTWFLRWTGEYSVALSLVAVAVDSAGQESEPTRTTVEILPPQ